MTMDDLLIDLDLEVCKCSILLKLVHFLHGIAAVAGVLGEVEWLWIHAEVERIHVSSRSNYNVFFPILA